MLNPPIAAVMSMFDHQMSSFDHERRMLRLNVQLWRARIARDGVIANFAGMNFK